MIELGYVQFSPFRKPKEKFFLLEVTPRAVRGLLLALYEDKTLRFLKSWNTICLADFFSARNAAAFFRTRSRWRTIVSLDPALAFTARIPFTMKRGSVGSPVESAELENFLGKTVSQLFNQYRESASRSLECGETDAVLVGSRVQHFRIDGHAVIDPLGFRARAVQGMIELTFVARPLYEELRPVFDEKKDCYITDSTRSEFAALLRVHDAPVSFAALRSARSFFATITQAPIGYAFLQKEFAWSATSFTDAIRSEWGISEAVARLIYNRYREKQLSSVTENVVSRMIQPAVKGLFGHLKRWKSGKGVIFLHSDEPFPFPLPQRREGIHVDAPPLELLMTKLGFRFDEKGRSFPQNELFGRLAPFVEFYYDKDKSDSQVNHWLRRRLHWLGAVHA
ncbi:MAG: hypothetical protein AAB652_00960 [Patescibacteria group bacterium]